MIRKGYVITSVISALIGAALAGFAAGNRQDRVIDDWIPLNGEIAAAVSWQEPPAEPKATSGAGAKATINSLPAPMSDAEKVGTPPPQQAQLETPVAASSAISINTASLTELTEIPGIGEKKAQAIIEYRTSHGLFKSVEDLTKIKGIGDKMLEKMKPHIRL